MNPLNATAAAPSLRADGLTDRAPGSATGSAPLAFAGLLGEQQQRWSRPSGESAAYDGSAFDVAPAQRESARAPVRPTPSPVREVEPTPQASADRERPIARLAPGAGPVTPSARPAQKPAEAKREASEATSRNGADAARADAAADAIVADAAAPADSRSTASVEEAVPATQALLDWMTRWTAPPGDVPLADGGALSKPPVAQADPQAPEPGAASVAAWSSGAVAASAASGEAVATAIEASGTAPAGPAARVSAAEAPIVLPASLQAGAALVPTDAAGASLQLATPVESPDFSRALASQLTTFARQGVHEAQLELNPADMGPISVQITLDGSQAQIDFAAAHARTRDALEAAWPALAAALHGAGLTLGGGGVSDHRPGARDGATPGREGGAAPGAADEAGAAAASRSVRIDPQRGLLDLYA